jgi:hypothetical protein
VAVPEDELRRLETRWAHVATGILVVALVAVVVVAVVVLFIVAPAAH